MRNQIKKLLASDLTSYRISVESGIPQSKIGYLRNGKAKLDNLSLAYAEKLQNYYEKVESEMKIMEIEQLKNDLETKVGTLSNLIKSGTIKDEYASELVEIFKEYEVEGATLEELKMLYEDVVTTLNIV